MQKAIAIDFDGCLCTNEYPNIGKPILHIIDEAKKQQAKGAGLILWTCREGKLLEEAVAACEKWGLHQRSYLNPIHEEVSRPGVGRLIVFWKGNSNGQYREVR